MWKKQESAVDQRVTHMQDEVAQTAERLISALRVQAQESIVDLGETVRATAHETATSVSEDIGRVSSAVASGLKTVAEELPMPQSFKEHPVAWAAGGVALGAASLTLMRRRRHRAAPMAQVVAPQSTLGRAVVAAALDLALGFWLSRRRQRRLALT